MNFDYKKFVLGGIVGGIVYYIASTIIGSIVQVFFPYNIFSLGGMRAFNDPVLLLFFLSPFVLSFAMALVFQIVLPAFKGNWVSKGINFGIITWVLAQIPGEFIIFSSMNYPLGFHVENFFGSLVYMVLAGIAIAKISE